MTSRELVISTLEFESPSRIPRQTWLLPWAQDRYPDKVKKIFAEFPDDIITAPSVYSKPLRRTGTQYEIGTYTDEWGCIFESRHRRIIGEVKGLLKMRLFIIPEKIKRDLKNHL